MFQLPLFNLEKLAFTFCKDRYFAVQVILLLNSVKMNMKSNKTRERSVYHSAGAFKIGTDAAADTANPTAKLLAAV